MFGKNLRIDLRSPLARAIGHSAASRDLPFRALRALSLPLARAWRAGLTVATLVATRSGVARVQVRPLRADEAPACARLLRQTGVEPVPGSVLAHDVSLGAFLGGKLVAAVVPAACLGEDGPPVLIAVSFARGSVERPLVDAAAARSLTGVRVRSPLPVWLRQLLGLA